MILIPVSSALLVIMAIVVVAVVTLIRKYRRHVRYKRECREWWARTRIPSALRRAATGAPAEERVADGGNGARGDRRDRWTRDPRRDRAVLRRLVATSKLGNK